MSQQSPPENNLLPPPEPILQQEVSNSTVSGGMQALQGDGNTQIQGQVINFNQTQILQIPVDDIKTLQLIESSLYKHSKKFHLVDGEALTKAWRMGIERILSRLNIPKRFWKEASFSLAFVLLLSLWGFHNYSLPWIATFYNKWGWENYREREYNSAQGNYEMALKLNPNYAEAHFNLGRLYEDLQDSERARSEYHLAIKGNLDKAYNNLARLYITNKKNPKYDEAVALLQKGLQVVKNDSIKYNLNKNLGWVRFEQKRYTDAKAPLQEAISLGSKRAAAYCLLAKVLDAQEAKKNALTQWENCLKYASSGRSHEEDRWIDEARKRLNTEGDKR
ncbi:tetratricopeptide repeat protein [Scytonema sp. NUACC26]|uniref:tetratricopeptide repeat protein n=1 Tax=Scytonema sp. NUACC26 TaxID=3140176 RepID=UPI0034DC1B8F